MSLHSGQFFVGPGDARPLLLGADGKTFLQLNPDGTVTLVNGATLPSLALTGAQLTTPTLTAPAIASSPTGLNVDRWAEVLITKANILAMNATPVVVVAALGTAFAIEFLDAVLVFDFLTAQYGGGGDVTIQQSGVDVSVPVVKTNAFGAAGDKVWSFPAATFANGRTIPVNAGLSITNATGAFTDPGTAAGTGRLKIHYRVIQTDL